MANVDQITESITSLRTETSPASVTPERVGALLQAIADLIAALSNVPEEDVVSVMDAVQQANSNAATALATATAAASAAAAQAIASLLAPATAQGVALTIKQVSHGNGSGISVALPIADATHAGIITPAVLQNIENAATLAVKNKLTSISFSYSLSGLTLNFKDADAETILSKTLPSATQNRAGLMTAGDKAKLDNIPPDGVAPIDDTGRIPGANAPQVMIRNIADQSGYFDEHPLQPGDFWFDSGHIFFHTPNGEEWDMGVPTKNVVYCHVDTDILYRWTGSMFTPIKTNPNEGLELRNIRVHSVATKRYDIPSGVFSRIFPSTNIVNMNLLEPSSGVPYYRILLDSGTFFDDGDALIVEQIDWPLSVNWQSQPPTIDEIIEGYGVIVTIIDNFARFEKF